jgi:hypothetical protein
VHGVGADDLTGRALALVVDHVGDLERRGCTIQRGQGLVADVQHATGDVLAAGRGERPGGLESVSLDPRCSERVEHRLHVGAPILDRLDLGDQAITVGAEDRPGLDGLAVGSHQTTDRHGEGASGRQRHRRVDHQGVVCRIVGLRVAFGPQWDAFAGLEVDDHHACVVGERRCQVGPRRQVRRGDVEAVDVGLQAGVGGETVVAVPLGEVDRDTVDVGGCAGSRKCDAQPGGGGGIGPGVVIARVGEEAVAGVEGITTLGLRCDRRIDGCHECSVCGRFVDPVCVLDRRSAGGGRGRRGGWLVACCGGGRRRGGRCCTVAAGACRGDQGEHRHGCRDRHLPHGWNVVRGTRRTLRRDRGGSEDCCRSVGHECYPRVT